MNGKVSLIIVFALLLSTSSAWFYNPSDDGALLSVGTLEKTIFCPNDLINIKSSHILATQCDDLRVIYQIYEDHDMSQGLNINYVKDTIVENWGGEVGYDWQTTILANRQVYSAENLDIGNYVIVNGWTCIKDGTEVWLNYDGFPLVPDQTNAVVQEIGRFSVNTDCDEGSDICPITQCDDCQELIGTGSLCNCVPSSYEPDDNKCEFCEPGYDGKEPMTKDCEEWHSCEDGFHWEWSPYYACRSDDTSICSGIHFNLEDGLYSLKPHSNVYYDVCVMDWQVNLWIFLGIFAAMGLTIWRFKK